MGRVSRRRGCRHALPADAELTRTAPAVAHATKPKPHPPSGGTAYETIASRVPGPELPGSTPRPGMTLARPVRPGTRAGCVHVTPSVERVRTMSLTSQSAEKRQSLHAAQIRPPPSTSAETNGGSLMPLTSSLVSGETRTGPVNVTPPFIERTAPTWSTLARFDSKTE